MVGLRGAKVKGLLGFGLYWAWVTVVFYSDTLTLFSDDPAASLETFWLWATWAHFVGLIVFALSFGRFSRALQSALACWTAGASMALGAVVVAAGLSFSDEPISLGISFLGAFLAGFPSALVLLQWANCYSEQPSASVSAASVLSFALGIVVYLLTRSFSSIVGFSLALLLPLASASLLVLQTQGSQGGEEGMAGNGECAEGSDGLASAAELERIIRYRSSREFVFGAIAAVASVLVFALCGELLRALSVRIGGQGAQTMGVPYLVGGFAGLGVLAVALLASRKDAPFRWLMTVPLLRNVALIMALAFLVAPFLDSWSIGLSYAIFGAGFWCFRAASWIVCFFGARHAHMRASTLVAVLDAAFAIAVVGGANMSGWLASVVSEDAVSMTTVSLFTVFVLMVVALAVLNSPFMRFMVSGLDAPVAESANAFEAVAETAASGFESNLSTSASVDVLADRFGLTPREREVAKLLAKGRSLPFIQNELHISRNTAQTHVRHIYRKLNVHTRQEFLDCVERSL